MAGKIFINYRRGEDSAAAGRLYDRLESEFPKSDLFMDVDNVPPGADFVTVLETQVAECDVLLAVIGKTWLDIKGTGGRRLDNPDFVRIEIASALRFGKRVIPVLVNGADMPSLEMLPEPLKPLSRRHAVRLTHERFRADAQGLINSLKVALAEAENERAARSEAEEARKKRYAGRYLQALWRQGEVRYSIVDIHYDPGRRQYEVAGRTYDPAGRKLTDFESTNVTLPSGKDGSIEFTWRTPNASTGYTRMTLGDSDEDYIQGDGLIVTFVAWPRAYALRFKYLHDHYVRDALGVHSPSNLSEEPEFVRKFHAAFGAQVMEGFGGGTKAQATAGKRPLCRKARLRKADEVSAAPTANATAGMPVV